MRQPDDLPALAALSARIGADPLLVQGAGGNTSVKTDDALWIKASGLRLCDATARDVFVEVDLARLRAAVRADDGSADRPAEFAAPGALRPSIETALHAVFAQRIVVHVHCAATIAVAIRADAGAETALRLAEFDAAFVPYVKPGVGLGMAVAAVLGPQTDVVVLGNHGLVVAARDVASAGALLARVSAAMGAGVTPLTSDPHPQQISLPGYRPCPPDHPLGAVARSAPHLAMAWSGSLYPDHVIFCGPGVAVLQADGTLPPGAPAPPFVLVPGIGALLRETLTEAEAAMARCLGDVLVRVPASAEVSPLSAGDEAALLDWDAEKYRQALNAC